MKTCLALNLPVVALMAVCAPAQADALHGDRGPGGTMVRHVAPNTGLFSLADILRESVGAAPAHGGHISSARRASFTEWPVVGSSRLTGAIGASRARIDLRPPLPLPYLGAVRGPYGAAGSSFVIDERTRLREGIGHARFKPQALLGADPRF